MRQRKREDIFWINRLTECSCNMHLSPAALAHKGNAESACKSLITTGLFTRSNTRGPLTFRSKARREAMRSAAPDTRQHERENKFNGRKKQKKKSFSKRVVVVSIVEVQNQDQLVEQV